MTNALSDTYSKVQDSAVQALASLVEARPIIAAEALTHVTNALSDGDWCVRASAIQAIARLVAISPTVEAGALT